MAGFTRAPEVQAQPEKIAANSPPIPHDDWGRVETKVDGGRLLWRFSKGETTPEGKPRESSRRVTAPRHAPDIPHVRQPLERFIALYDQPDEAISAFADEHGVLELCRHRLPAHHHAILSDDDFEEQKVNEDVTVLGVSPRTAYRAGCEIPRTDDGYYWEPIAEWRRLSREAFAILTIADSARKGGPGSEGDWEAMLGHKFSPNYRDSIGYPPSPARARFAVATSVNAWLEAGQARPIISWEGATPAVSFGSHSLFGTLALQLAAAVGRWGLATCDVCGHAYFPTRRPQRGRHTYCGNCKGAASRLSRQRPHQSKRQKRSRRTATRPR